MRRNLIFTLIVILLLLFAGFGKTVSAQTAASIYFSPSNELLPPEKTFNLMLDSQDSKIAFVKIEVMFDKNKVNMTSEIVPSKFFGMWISLTGVEEANSNGRALVVVGLSPEQVKEAPSGQFEVAKLSFGPVSGADYSLGHLSIGENVQIVDINANEVPFITNDATLTIDASSGSPCNLSGDANGDCVVDGVDYALWYLNFGLNTPNGKNDGDFDNSGAVNGVDYAFWYINFGG